MQLSSLIEIDKIIVKQIQTPKLGVFLYVGLQHM